MSFATTVMFGALRRQNEHGRGLTVVRIGIRRVADADRELLEVVELAERAEQPDVTIEAAVAGAKHRPGVAEEIPRDAGARPEVVLVAPLAHVHIRQRHRKAVRIEILIGVSVEPLVAQSQVDGDVLPQTPVVLNEGDVVLRGV
jgi:hypothetical protein